VSNEFASSFPQLNALPVGTVRLGLISRIFSGGTPDRSNMAFWQDGDLPWVASGEVNQFSVCRPSELITRDAVYASATKLMPENSIIIALAGQGKTKAMVAQMAIDAYGNQSLACIDRFKGHNRFLLWWLTSLYREIRGLSSLETRDGLNQSIIGQLPVPLFCIDTQKSIADFLDRETARIDQLIEKREAFLSLIDEKKTSLAGKAVDGSILKGVGKGIEGWFGALPESWLVKRAKFLFRERQDRSEAGEEELLTVSHLTGVTRRSDKDVNMFLAESTEGYKLVSEGDVVINTMWAWMGAMGVSPVEGLISPSYGVYAPRGNAFEADYLDLLLRSRPFVAEATRRSKGIHSSRLRLYPDAFLDIRLPVPSRDAQRGILTALKAATEREEQLATLSRLSLGRLREFRAALITAAVTGQIDVATWGKRGTTDRRFDAIEADMAVAQLERHQVRA
jgi:type I restriction enzyme S subunit